MERVLLSLISSKKEEQMNLSDEILEELTRAQKSSIILTYRIKTLLSDAELWEKEDITNAVEWILHNIYALNNAFVSIGK